MNIYSQSLEDLENYFLSINQKKFKAIQVYDWLYKKEVNSFEEIGKLHSVIEMDITPQEIAKYIDVKYVKKIYKYIERKIMIGELSNDKETIKEFLKNIDLKDILKETDYE